VRWQPAPAKKGETKMKVYLVIYTDYDRYETVAVFRNRESAERYKETLWLSTSGEYEIESFEVQD
jgi:hypothetical protein